MREAGRGRRRGPGRCGAGAGLAPAASLGDGPDTIASGVRDAPRAKCPRSAPLAPCRAPPVGAQPTRTGAHFCTGQGAGVLAGATRTLIHSSGTCPKVSPKHKVASGLPRAMQRIPSGLQGSCYQVPSHHTPAQQKCPLLTPKRRVQGQPTRRTCGQRSRPGSRPGRRLNGRRFQPPAVRHHQLRTWPRKFLGLDFERQSGTEIGGLGFAGTRGRVCLCTGLNALHHSEQLYGLLPAHSSFPPTAPRSGSSWCPHFTDKDTEAQGNDP